MGDSAIIPTYFLAKRAVEQGIKVVLCGAGGDELFGGYTRHYRGRRDYLSGALPFIPLKFWQALNTLNSGFLQYGTIAWDHGVAFGLSTSGVNVGILDRLLMNPGMLLRSIELVKNQFSKLVSLEKNIGFQYGRMVTDIGNYLPDNVLALIDRTTMAVSVEARVPFLDHRLAKFIFSMPQENFLDSNFRFAKKSLKSAFATDLPEEIITRDKVGFNAPVNHWFTSRNPRISERLLDLQTPEIKNIIMTDHIRNIWNDDRRRLKGAEMLFKLYIADLWFEKHG